jgi:hypothetical protein
MINYGKYIRSQHRSWMGWLRRSAVGRRSQLSGMFQDNPLVFSLFFS